MTRSPQLGNALTLLGLYLLVTLAALARPYIPIDETRYLSVAWEMWDKGQFLVPHMNGETYSHKPPLLFWLMHLGWTVSDVNGVWPKLIMPLAALLAHFHLYRLARRMGTAEFAWRATLILGAMLLWVTYSGVVMFDVLLTACILGAIVPLISADGSVPGRKQWLTAGMWLGLALLTKGPVALLTWGIVFLSAPLWREKTPGGWWRGGTMALGVGILMLLCWALPAAWQGGEAFARMLLWGQTADRMVNAFDHARPWYWYLYCLPLLLFPAVFWQRLYPRRRAASTLSGSQSPDAEPDTDSAPTTVSPRLARLPWLWALGGFAIFTLISAKQVHYLMPLLPGLALIAAQALGRASKAPTRLWGLGVGWGLLAAVGFGLWLFGKPPLNGDVDPLGAALLMAIAAGALAWRWTSLQAALRGLVLINGLAFVATVHVMLAPLWSAYDVAPPARLIAEWQANRGPVGVDNMSYQATFQFAGRFTEPLEQLDDKDIPAWRRAHPDGLVVLHIRNKEDAPEQSTVFTYRGHYIALEPATPPDEAAAAAEPVAPTTGTGTGTKATTTTTTTTTTPDEAASP
ncbi:4-amino-4-deoxy-L-arabinose transferase-like glycosyltransferase [Onishia taeanensis]|uniref:4-amino-4-deoxy-L-arabinose transferase-like glycosyltransferase n=1 Tax=Onishia taeanensis TaxID=284577 RepID=A0A328XPF3_9GAMM|nr:glycosyltransferase family 39 protein [Halomonas taeanensis]RAR60801.1 4-amino-4-deoxy-L-arabinose transferase-like glycosyltransferase [Halomonas taeanensis]